MKQLAISSIVTLIILGGLAIFSLAGAKSPQSTNGPAPVGIPSSHQMPALLPDADYVPIYPGATVRETTNKSIAWNRFILTAHDDINAVHAFYEDKLPKLGWVFVDTGNSMGLGLYTWTAPSGTAPWHLFLKVAMSPTLDGKETSVTLIYGRYPDVEDNLPLHPDAQQIETSHSEKPGDTRFGAYPIRVTIKTYQTSATPAEVADFYNNSMREYGWFFFNRTDVVGSSVQTGDIYSEEGLYFTARPPYMFKGTVLSYQLFITATMQEDGQTRVTLRLDIVESSLPDF